MYNDRLQWTTSTATIQHQSRPDFFQRNNNRGYQEVKVHATSTCYDTYWAEKRCQNLSLLDKGIVGPDVTPIVRNLVRDELMSQSAYSESVSLTRCNCNINPSRTEVYFCHQNQNAKNISNFTTLLKPHNIGTHLKGTIIFKWYHYFLNLSTFGRDISLLEIFSKYLNQSLKG
jgi:hypothetical protein